MPEFSIVIPAYNESDKITSSLTQVVNFMREYAESFEVFVIDDGSTDDTADVVEDYSKDIPEITLIRNPHKGKAFSVYTGMQKASGKYIYMADADLSAPMSELKKFMVWMKDHDYDVVIGSREGIGASRIGEPWYRHIMGRVFNYMVQILVISGISDTQCGFKLFTHEAAKNIFSNLTVVNENTKTITAPYTGAWDVEALFIAKKFGYKIKQVSITWTHVKSTRVSPLRDSIKMALEILKIRLNDITGKYKGIKEISR